MAKGGSRGSPDIRRRESAKKGMMVRLTVLLMAGAVLSGCASFPDVDAAQNRIGSGGPAPALVPLDDVLPGATQRVATQASAEGVEGRAAALRAKAATLRNR